MAGKKGTVPDSTIIDAYNDIDGLPRIQDVAEHVGLQGRHMQKRLQTIRASYPDGTLIDRTGHYHNRRSHEVMAMHNAQARHDALDPRSTPGFSERELTTHYSAEGDVTGSTVREGPASLYEAGGVDAGPERDGGDGFLIKGVSTYFDAAGNQRGQWVKTKLDELSRQTSLNEAAAALAETLPRLPPIPAPAPSASLLCNLFTITDAHVGMLAWHREGGDDWDLKIAEETLLGTFSHMISGAPRARVAVVNQLGDFLHFDGLEAVTPMHRHNLDADGRFRKIVGTAIRILRRMVDMVLATHDEVHVVMAEGNHDVASSAWLQTMFAALYELEPRVTINDAALPFYVYRHGQVMLGFHHGHTKRNDGLPLHFAASYPEIWGATTTRYIHVGHRHHVEEKEHSGVKVVQHSTLAARDAYAARGGWHTCRQAIAITYHEEFGEVARMTATPGML